MSETATAEGIKGGLDISTCREAEVRYTSAGIIADSDGRHYRAFDALTENNSILSMVAKKRGIELDSDERIERLRDLTHAVRPGYIDNAKPRYDSAIGSLTSGANLLSKAGADEALLVAARGVVEQAKSARLANLHCQVSKLNEMLALEADQVGILTLGPRDSDDPKYRIVQLNSFMVGTGPDGHPVIDLECIDSKGNRGPVPNNYSVSCLVIDRTR